jgi:hypothetical protein
MEKKGIIKQYQQGDVLIRRIDELPDEKVKLDHGILAYGEATGHCHEVLPDVINLGQAVLYQGKDGNLYLHVKEGKEVEVKHQEHKNIMVAPGNYLVDKVVEYDHFLEETRQVRD